MVLCSWSPAHPCELGVLCCEGNNDFSCQRLGHPPAALEPKSYCCGRELGGLGLALMDLKGLDTLGSSRNFLQGQDGAICCQAFASGQHGQDLEDSVIQMRVCSRAQGSARGIASAGTSQGLVLSSSSL